MMSKISRDDSSRPWGCVRLPYERSSSDAMSNHCVSFLKAGSDELGAKLVAVGAEAVEEEDAVDVL